MTANLLTPGSMNEDFKPGEHYFEGEKNSFKYFWRFMANNETFLIPIDHQNFSKSSLSTDLLFDVVNGREAKIMSLDFSTFEKIHKVFKEYADEEMKNKMNDMGEYYETEKEKLQRKYSYFRPNREFTGERENLKLYKVDDGTYINNGYK